MLTVTRTKSSPLHRMTLKPINQVIRIRYITEHRIQGDISRYACRNGPLMHIEMKLNPYRVRRIQ